MPEEAAHGVRFYDFSAGGNMGPLIQAKDWSHTSLGPMSEWPLSLRNYLKMILELPTAAIVFWGPEQVQLYNDGYSVIMGPRHPAYLGATFRECWPEAYDGIHPWMERVLHRGETVAVNRTLVPLARRGYTEEAYFTFSFSPLRDDAGNIAGILQLVTEVTDSVLNERRAAEADRAKTEFFSNVSHEFRTPLTLILGPVEDALREPEQVLKGSTLESVHRNGLRLLRLVNTLLDFARLESGRLALSFAPTDLARLTTDLAGSFRSLVERAGLALVVDCPAMPEPVYVDVSHWEKIVLNLLSNAFKFTFRGEIVVCLRARADHVLLSVRDTGGGIPSGELPRIFERFHRVEGARGRSFEGTGIGLSLVDELVRLHGGSVRVSSVEGEGSTFEVMIPRGKEHLPRDRMVEPTRAESARASTYLLEAAQWMMSHDTEQMPGISDPQLTVNAEPADQKRARILVVDDNRDMREYLERLLSPRFQVELADDGHMALVKAKNEPPDLILSDVMMPRMDGVELLRELRAHPRTSHLPVVLLSARAGEEAVLQGLETGADDYLVKPFAARELFARVQTHLQLARLRREWSRELERAYAELEAFSYSVSHDLRAPLRAIDGFSKVLLDDYEGVLDERGRHCLGRVRSRAQRMGELIDDLLNLSRIARAPIHRTHVDLSSLARRALADLQGRDPERRVELCVAEGLVAQGDPRLLLVLLENLLGNAWKFTAHRSLARIDMGRDPAGDGTVFYIRDNGAGFDMQYAQRLFAPFHRLHEEGQFEGTGIGLAIVQRIVTRHHGRVWASAAAGQGATFFFTLGAQT